MKKDLMLEFLEEYYKKNGTINDIPNGYEVMYQGKRLSVYAFLSRMRSDYNNYQSNNKRKGIDSSLALERYQKLTKMNFDWSLRNHTRSAFFDTDIYIKYLEEYYQKHQTINDISENTEVEYEGQILKIGAYLKEMRNRYLKYGPIKFESKVKSRKVVAQYKKLTEMNFAWTNKNDKETKKQLNLSYSDIYIRALQSYYQEHGTINNIPEKKIIEVNGEKLQIGAFLQRIRARFREDSQNNFENVTKLRQKRYQALQTMEFNFVLPEKEKTINEIARENNIDEQVFQKLVKCLSGNREKALKIMKSQEKLKQRKEKETQKDLVLSEFLQSNNLSTEDFLNAINKKSTTNNTNQLEYNETITLEEFCLTNNLNFELLSKAVRLKTKLLPEEDFASVVNRVVIDSKITTKRYISSWIYTAYPNVLLIKSLLTENNLSWESVFRNIRENIYTLDEALVAEAFRSNRENGQLYLEGLYYEYVDLAKKLNNNPDKKILLEEYKEHIISEYSLTEEEIGTITKSFTTYEDISHQMQLLDVAFEKNPEIKETKIIQYNFTEKDIEEAFLFPLSFQETEVIGKNNEIYQRRQLIKNITSTWQSLSSEEKTTIINNNTLTPTEISYVISTTKAIASTKEKIFKK